MRTVSHDSGGARGRTGQVWPGTDIRIPARRARGRVRVPSGVPVSSICHTARRIRSRAGLLSLVRLRVGTSSHEPSWGTGGARGRRCSRSTFSSVPGCELSSSIVGSVGRSHTRSGIPLDITEILLQCDFAHRRAGGCRKMTVFGSLRSRCALLLTGFTLITTMLLAQPASADELIPSNVGVHFWESPGFRELQSDPRVWEVPGQPPCPPNKQCADTAFPLRVPAP